MCTSEPCLDTLDIIYFSKKIGYFFLPRRIHLDTYARSNEFYLDGSRKGESLPRTLKSTGNDFPANFQRVCRLIFSHRAIRIISVDTPFFPFFLPSLPFFSLLFFPAQRFYRKTFSPFQSTTHSREAKYFHTPRQNCFRTWRNTDTLFGICCNFHSNNVSMFYE